MNKKFIYALGVGAAVYISLQLLNLILLSTLRFLQTFANWYRGYGVHYAGWAAGAAVVLFWLWAAVFSKDD